MKDQIAQKKETTSSPSQQLGRDNNSNRQAHTGSQMVTCGVSGISTSSGIVMRSLMACAAATATAWPVMGCGWRCTHSASGVTATPAGNSTNTTVSPVTSLNILPMQACVLLRADHCFICFVTGGNDKSSTNMTPPCTHDTAQQRQAEHARARSCTNSSSKQSIQTLVYNKPQYNVA